MNTGNIAINYIGFALLGSAFFFIFGFVLRKYTAKMKVKRAEDNAKNIITKSKVDAERRKREAALEAKDMLLKMRTEFAEETKERRRELSATEKRLLQREENLDRKVEIIDQKGKGLEKTESEIRQKK